MNVIFLENTTSDGHLSKADAEGNGPDSDGDGPDSDGNGPDSDSDGPECEGLGLTVNGSVLKMKRTEVCCTEDFLLSVTGH